MLLITGVAGFIGAALAEHRLQQGDVVVGIDNLNDYYDPELKLARLERLSKYSDFTFKRLDITDQAGLADLFAKYDFSVVVNLAAQAGVRYSLENPHAYIQANVLGFTNVIECCRLNNIKNFVYASSSSVYGANTRQPFIEKMSVAHQVSLYGATKKADELIAHSYSHLFNLPTTGLRFFTVYGPWGRPDMALFMFTKAMLEDKEIELYNQGDMVRDFTYIDDVVAGISKAIDNPAQPDPNWDANNPRPDTSNAPYTIYNIGCSHPEPLLSYVNALEATLGKQAQLRYVAMQPGDVVATHADVSKLQNDFGYSPSVTISTGVAKFVEWYLQYYGEK